MRRVRSRISNPASITPPPAARAFRIITAALVATLDQLYASAHEFGGLTSGEHGIGLAKRRFFLASTPPENLAAMRAIKGALDPRGILNPGKSYQA